MFCGNIFTSTDLQNHKKNHMKKSPKRFHRVNRASFLSLSNEFKDQKLMAKISPKKILGNFRYEFLLLKCIAQT